MINKIFNFLYYTIIYHFFWLLCEITLPNLHACNLIRGKVLGIFFKKVGSNFAIARSCTLIMTRNIEVGDDVYLAHGVWINGVGGLKFSNGVIVSPKVIIASAKHVYRDGSVRLKESVNKKITIGSGVWVCSNSTVTMGVSIGDGSVIAANSSVISDVEPYCLYAGVPAKKIKSIK
ncbi:acyltransferase [Vibrio diabolicus]|uniref:acyltransferase n=1 Tax=Vibrio TaxID=662 RepID=UPI001F314354|nr:acyltransferase [Vibrio diabolicus]EGQ8040212.1 acyltransferase [Vibrio alginolyticus]MCF7372051.1 acyltransferase [Vibrio sp. J2-3(2022)]MCS0024712.1 acyltransferase [Vibrio antiquarius]MCS0320375.1 acyltransferase [Vibrio diabolicus]MCS0446664.1 acyltransferase [Vibrio diabolicus]